MTAAALGLVGQGIAPAGELRDVDGRWSAAYGIGPDGAVQMDATNNPVPMQGWSQRVVVEKVDVYNFNTVRDHAYQQVATPQLPFIAVDQFPLRVTVIVSYQDPSSTQAVEVTRLTWVVSP